MAKFTVAWTEFTVLKKHDVDRDKPYLWVFGIVVDAQSIESGSYVIRRPSGSGNLGQKLGKGDRVSVPSSLDVSREVTPLLGLAAAGVVVVAWENAMTRDDVIADAYDAAADAVNRAVADLVTAAFDQLAAGQPIESIDLEPSEAQMRELSADVEAEVRATIRDGWSVFQAVPDHNIGTAYAFVFLDEPVEQCLDFRFTKRSTDYELEGDLSYAVATGPTGPIVEPGDIPIKHQEPKPTSTRHH